MARQGLGQLGVSWPVVQHGKQGQHQRKQANQGADQRGGQAQSSVFGESARRGRRLLPAKTWGSVIRIGRWGSWTCLGFALAWLQHRARALLKQPLAGQAIVRTGLAT